MSHRRTTTAVALGLALTACLAAPRVPRQRPTTDSARGVLLPF